jgi:uncharacterized protein (TIGR02284 family)
MAQNNIIDDLNRLVSVNKNAEAGFASAAESVKNSELETLFGNYAKQHSKFATELQDEVRRLKGDITDSGTFGGALHRSWMDLKAALSGGAAATSILKSCEGAEQSVEVAYIDAVDANPSGQTHALITKQRAQIEGFRTHLARLVGETKDGVEFQKNE